MAAFTSAVEQAAAGAELSRGFFAHTLGTDLGTGWVLPDGSIPEMPLEVYNFIVDLGSFGQRAFDPEDARSVRNVNTGLCGTLQKCAGQSGVFRLGAKYLPERDPKTYARLFERGLFARDGERLLVPTAPADMRKPCLEFFMREAEDPSSVCAELFRAVGESLGVCWKETQDVYKRQSQVEPRIRRRLAHGEAPQRFAGVEHLAHRRGIVPARVKISDDLLRPADVHRRHLDPKAGAFLPASQ